MQSIDEKPKSTTARNPISLRLYNVLRTNYDDPSIRDALETLSDLYKPPDSTKGKDVDAEDKEQASYDAEAKLATRHVPSSSGTAVRARKSLRRDAELKLAQGSRQFVRAFQEVDKHLDVLQEHIDAMRVRCGEAQQQLHSTNESCRSLLERAGGLRSARNAINEQKMAVDSFLAHFTLTEEEADSLRSRDIHIDSKFFRTMRKAERIIDDSRVLMSGEDGATKAGVEIIAATSRQLEEGYDKLARWCSLEFRQFVRDALLEVTPLMVEAIRWLRKKPELLSEVLSILSQTRQSTLLNSFTDALTRGGPGGGKGGGLPRPIEIHAHDPLRYVGDMLAWVHQSIAGEREFLEGLFGVKGDRRMVGSVRKFEDSEEEGWIAELMDRAFEKLRFPLKVKSCIASYRVANLLIFYNLTMRRTIGEKAGLSDTLNEITDEAYKVFMDTVEAQARSLARTLLPDDQDTQPPISLLDHTQVLRELMNVYKSSLMGDESPDELREGFKGILDVMVDAAVNMCLSVSDARKEGKGRVEWDGDVFVLNCLAHLIGVIRPFTFTDYKVEELQKDIDARAELLIEDHYTTILHDTSLYPSISLLTSRNTKDSSSEEEPTFEPLSHAPPTSPQNLTLSLRAFSTWLSSPDQVLHPPRLSHLLNQHLASHIHHSALRKLVSAYELLCSEVRRPENRYEAANTILGAQRPFGSLVALRQVLGVEEEDNDKDDGRE
ncbi:oligomeric complex COG6 [Fomitiporia mediterranea MF3/22]|uniref:oligomeric complex COG6 n=1 Tax=Fomitiporia mediterranea (strain MF3/22) TaxID=694068 RepID=UPI0004408194|nr:oligomeric complex COG6 [Fomitiporia mediterranea MF3/22]EJD05807.1 oligomeric complex COG6 [Fomitiporia mediterranea MF3/22]